MAKGEDMMLRLASIKSLAFILSILVTSSTISLLLFVAPAHSDTNFSDLVRIQDPSSSAGDLFGWSVAAAGDNILVGAPGVNNGAGAAYLFDGTTGTLIGTYQKPTQLQR